MSGFKRTRSALVTDTSNITSTSVAIRLMLTLDEKQPKIPQVDANRDGRYLPSRLWSLWDVIPRMATFFWRVHELLVELEVLAEPRQAPTLPMVMPITTIGTSDTWLSALSSGLSPSEMIKTAQEMPPDRLQKAVIDHLDLVDSGSAGLELIRTQSRIKRVREYMDSLSSLPLDTTGDVKLVNEIRVLREALKDDLADRPVLFPDVQKYKRYFGEPKPFGAEVYEAFAPARRDISGAGSCYATDNPTACVFHCMRAAEYGLRALAKRLLPRMRPEKLESGPIIRDLRRRIEEMHKPGRKGLNPKRERLLDFYSEALDQCVYFQNASRRHDACARALRKPRRSKGHPPY